MDRAEYKLRSKQLMQELENTIAVNRRLHPKPPSQKNVKTSNLEANKMRELRTAVHDFQIQLQQNQEFSQEFHHKLDQNQNQKQNQLQKTIDTKDCIDLDRFLDTSLFKLSHHKYGRGNLLEFWYSLFGAYRESFEHFFITPTALDKILAFFESFEEGFPFNDMSHGFLLAPGKDGPVLCFDSGHVSQSATPHTKSLTVPRLTMVQLWGWMRQFNAESVNDMHLSHFFVYQDEFAKDKQELLEALKAEGLKQKFAPLDNLIEFVTALNHKNNGRAFVYLMQNLSLAKLHTLIKGLTINPQRFSDFKANVLDHTEDWTPFLEPAYESVVQNIYSLDIPEYTWWNTLIASHMKQQPGANLPELWQAFSYFKEQYCLIMDCEHLSETCPFEHAKDMQIRLSNFLDFLKHHKNPQHSHSEWQDLDFTPTGFPLALLKGQPYVDAKMQLKPILKEDEVFYSWSKNTPMIIEIGAQRPRQGLGRSYGSELFVNRGDVVYTDGTTLWGGEGSFVLKDPERFERTAKFYAKKYESKPGYYSTRKVKLNTEEMYDLVYSNLQYPPEQSFALFNYEFWRGKYKFDIRYGMGDLDRNSTHAETITPLNYHVNEGILSHAIKDNTLTFEHYCTLFYRYLGNKQWTADLKVYEDIIVHLRENKYLSLEDKKNLLHVLAIFSTTFRGKALQLSDINDQIFFDKELVSYFLNYFAQSAHKPTIYELSILGKLIQATANFKELRDLPSAEQNFSLNDDPLSLDEKPIENKPQVSISIINPVIEKIFHSYELEFLEALGFMQTMQDKLDWGHFYEKIIWIDRYAPIINNYPADEKKILLKPPFLYLNAEISTHLFESFKTNPNYFTELFIITQMPFDWFQMLSLKPQDWVNVLEQSSKLEDHQAKVELIKDTLFDTKQDTLDIRSKDKAGSYQYESFKDWEKSFLVHYGISNKKAPGKLTLEGKHALLCVEIINSFPIEKKLIHLFSKQAKTLEKWSVFSLYTD